MEVISQNLAQALLHHRHYIHFADMGDFPQTDQANSSHKVQPPQGRKRVLLVRKEKKKQKKNHDSTCLETVKPLDEHFILLLQLLFLSYCVAVVQISCLSFIHFPNSGHYLRVWGGMKQQYNCSCFLSQRQSSLRRSINIGKDAIICILLINPYIYLSFFLFYGLPHSSSTHFCCY